MITKDINMVTIILIATKINNTPNAFENFSQRVLRHGEDKRNFFIPNATKDK